MLLTRHNASDTGGRDEDSEPRLSVLRGHLVIYTRLVSTSLSNVKCVLSRRKPLAKNTRKQLASCADALSSTRNDSSPHAVWGRNRCVTSSERLRRRLKQRTESCLIWQCPVRCRPLMHTVVSLGVASAGEKEHCS